jgi:hypothetical protein
MKIRLKSKLITSFTAVILITGIISAVIGTYLINKWTIGQAQDRIRNSLLLKYYQEMK